MTGARVWVAINEHGDVGWEGGRKWKGASFRNWGGGAGKVESWLQEQRSRDHEGMLSPGLEAEARLLIPLLSVNICENPQETCVSCLPLYIGSFCKNSLNSAANFSQREMCCGCKGVMLFSEPSRCHPGISGVKGRGCFSMEGIASKPKQAYVERASR